jgi:two-component system, OmpR family, phosphate regulon sensor histidine kinase PhoR
MKRKILRSMLLVSFVTVLLTAALLSFAFYQQLSAEMKQEMKNQAVYIAAGIQKDGINYLTSVQGENENSRITLIDTDGTVLFDNRASIDQMDNHKERPEVLAAIQYGIGEAVRMSDTIGSQTYYLALLLPDSTILRISSTTDTFLASSCQHHSFNAPGGPGYFRIGFFDCGISDQKDCQADQCS